MPYVILILVVSEAEITWLRRQQSCVYKARPSQASQHQKVENSEAYETTGVQLKEV